MKKISIALLFAITIFSATSLSAQLRKIPAAVTEAMKEKYPGATDISWSDNITNFEAKFNLDEHEQAASFTKKGVWKRTEKSISNDEIPADVKDGLSKSKYNDWEIQSAKEIIDNANKHQYRLLMKKNDLQKKYLFFNTEGVLIRDAITI
jgi:hypothetical protein